jgi:hypothetical protein
VLLHFVRFDMRPEFLETYELDVRLSDGRPFPRVKLTRFPMVSPDDVYRAIGLARAFNPAGWSEQPPEGATDGDLLELVLAGYSKYWGAEGQLR